MKYFVAYLEMLDPDKNQTFRAQHLAFLKNGFEEGKVFACGPFQDGSGGMVIYAAESLEAAEEYASQDPYVIEKVRRLQLKEWGMTQQL